jgi:RNA polymerase sigma-70 factor (ECF subfamily)
MGDLPPSDAADQRQKRAVWVAAHILPNEARVRRWLHRWPISREDVDELLQDAYCRISLLDSVEHIDRPFAYFFSIVRNLLARSHRRQRVISLELIAEVEAYNDYANTVEEQASDRLVYEKIVSLIGQLPPRCRQIIRLRKLDDWSHKQIAAHLGISEKTVECQVRLGIRAIRDAWERQEAQSIERSDRDSKAGAGSR